MKQEIQKIVDLFATLDFDDPEETHAKADTLLLEALKIAGLDTVVAAYLETESKCGGFWYA